MARKKDVPPAKPASSKGRGKTQDRHATIEKLKPYFQTGLPINRACDAFNANSRKEQYIARSTVQYWYDHDEEVRQKIDAWKDTMSVLARQALLFHLQVKNPDIAKWLLERRESSEFGKDNAQALPAPINVVIALPPNPLPDGISAGNAPRLLGSDAV